MSKQRTFIVAARDFESSRSAAQRAAQLTNTGDRIVIAHAQRQSPWLMLGMGEMRHAIPDLPLDIADDQSWLDTLAASIKQQRDVQVEKRVLDGPAGKQIEALAKELDACLIVTGAQRDGVARALALGSTALRILRHAPCPVLVAQNIAGDEYRKATLAVADDPSAERVVDAALNILPMATLSLLHAYGMPDDVTWQMQGVTPQVMASIRAGLRDQAERAMKPLLARARTDDLRLVRGFPGISIVDDTEKNVPDVLVISQHRGPPIGERVLGSVTQHALYNCRCDLLLVP